MDNDSTKNVSAGTDDLGIVFNAPHTDTPEAVEVPQDAPAPAPIREKKNSNLSNRDDVFDVTRAFSSEHGGGGAVISDRRHHRASIKENLKSAFAEWMGNTQATIDRALEVTAPKAVKEEPMVAMGSSRTEVVREAAEHATIAPQDDHETVLKQFHTYQNDVDRVNRTQEVIIKNPVPKIIKSSWTYTQNEPKKEVSPLQMPDLRSAMVAPVVSPKSKPTDTPISHTTPPQPEIKKSSERGASSSFSSITHSEAHASQNRSFPKGSTVPPTISQVITPHNKVATIHDVIQAPTPQERDPLVQVPNIPTKTTVTKLPVSVTNTPSNVVPKSPQTPPDNLPVATSLTKEEVVGSWTHVIEDAPKIEVITDMNVPQENMPIAKTPPEIIPVKSSEHIPTPPLSNEKAVVTQTSVSPTIAINSATTFATGAHSSPREILHSAEKGRTSSQSTISVRPPTTSNDLRRPIVHTSEVKPTRDSVPAPQKQRPSVSQSSWVPVIPSIYLFSGVGIVAFVLLIGVGAYSGFFSTTENSSSETNIPTSFGTILPTSFFTVAHIVNEPLTTDKGTFFATVQKHIEQNIASDVQVRPTITENKSIRGATTQEFFTMLDIPLSYALIKSLDPTFMFGGIHTTKQEPYLIIRSYNFEELFAGLLSWEGTMQGDFAPIFGIQKSPTAPFVDAVQNNKSTRILYDASGNEVLLYSFINHNTVVITTSGEALSAIIGKF